MAKQPAKVNYFFKGAYVELLCTIAATFCNLGRTIADAAVFTFYALADFFDHIWDAIKSIFAVEFDWDEILASIVALCKFGFGFGKLVCILVLTTGLCVFFSAVHVIVLLCVMLIAYSLQEPENRLPQKALPEGPQDLLRVRRKHRSDLRPHDHGILPQMPGQALQ